MSNEDKKQEQSPELVGGEATENVVIEQHPQGILHTSKAGVALMWRTAPMDKPVLTIEQHVNWQGLQILLPSGEAVRANILEEFKELHGFTAANLADKHTVESFDELIAAHARKLNFNVDIFALAFIREQLRTAAAKDKPADGLVEGALSQQG